MHKHTVTNIYVGTTSCNMAKIDVKEGLSRCFCAEGDEYLFKCPNGECDFGICYRCTQANEFLKRVINKDKEACIKLLRNFPYEILNMIKLNRLSYEIFSHKHVISRVSLKNRAKNGIHYLGWTCNSNFKDRNKPKDWPCLTDPGGI